MSTLVREKKRWRVARVAVWTAILGGSLLFWVAVVVAVLGWLR